jgi:hypothetical protein
MSCSDVSNALVIVPPPPVEGPSRASPELSASPPSEKRVTEIAVSALKSGSEEPLALATKKIDPVVIPELKNSQVSQPDVSQGQKVAEETHDSLPQPKARKKVSFTELSKMNAQEIEQEIAKMSPEEIGKFVEHRKRLMEKRLEEWKKNYDPAPTWTLRLAGLSEIVRLESIDVLEALINAVTRARTREKIASILRKNEVIMKRNMSHMNDATQKKMNEGLEIIKRELSKLGTIPESVKSPGAKNPRIVDPKDPLFTEKTEFLRELDAWKKDFHPQPAALLSCFSGDEVSERAKGLFVDLRQRVIKAESKQACLRVFTAMHDLISAYKAAVNSSTSSKLDAALTLIKTAQKGLEAP